MLNLVRICMLGLLCGFPEQEQEFLKPKYIMSSVLSQ